MSQKSTIMTGFRFVPLLIGALSVAACAEAIDSWGPSTRIEANPRVARCTLEGKGLQREVVTPVRVVLPKEASPVTVTCAAEGYRTSVHRMTTRIDNSIASNLLFGSSIGMIVDIMSGAAEQYPSRITVNLEPRYFASAEARDEWYGKFRASLDFKWSGIIDDLWATCNQDLEAQLGCTEELARREAERDHEFKVLEDRRAAAEIRTGVQAQGGLGLK